MQKITALAASVVAAAALTALATTAPPAHRHDMSTTAGGVSQALATQLAASRLATAKYATNLALAKKNGYGSSRMIPDMGWHFMNPKITSVRRQEAADPRVRQAGLVVAARRLRVGLPREAEDGTAPGRDVRLVRRGVPLQGRDVHLHGEPGRRVPRRARRPGRRSGSGTPTSSRSTSGPGTRTRTACSRA